MTTERSGKSLEMLRDELAMYSEEVSQPTLDRVYAWVAVIDAELATRGAVVSDREHIVEVFPRDMPALLKWLSSPNGGFYDVPQLCVESVAGGGLLIRTNPSAALRKVAVPDERDLNFRTTGYHSDYDQGWNACREAMLASQDEVK